MKRWPRKRSRDQRGRFGGLGSFSVLAQGLTFQVGTTFALATAGITCGNLTYGMEANITDGSTATWGATVTGGGTQLVKIRCNSGAWTVVGK